MLTVTLIALLTAHAAPPPAGPASPAGPAPELSLASLPGPAPRAKAPVPSAASAALAQGTVRPVRPMGFVTLGVQSVVDGDVGSATGDDPDYDDADVLLDLGFYTWNDSLGMALEFSYIPSSYEIDASALASDDVDVTRYLIGIRLVDDEPDSRFLYHLRAGLAYREDDGEVVDDDGTGWYFGGGIEWKLPGGFSAGPELLYIETDSVDSNDLILGLGVSYAF